MRLDKYLADMGVGSRSDIKKMIRDRKVTVNGVVIRDAAYQLSMNNMDNPDCMEGVEVCIDGRPIQYEKDVYYMLNKPAGILSAAEDRRQKTVVDLIRDGEEQAGRPVRTDLFPVGRLDKDTEGLLLITNDGQLAHQLLAPKHHIDKVYYAIVSGGITQEDVKRFRQGIQYDHDLMALPAELVVMTQRQEADALQHQSSPVSVAPDTPRSEVRITIREGKFHQIRKMVAALGAGKEVLYLKRIAMGSLSLDSSLAPGQYRRLTAQEVALLKMHL